MKEYQLFRLTVKQFRQHRRTRRPEKDPRIVVTTIQKLNNLIKSENGLPIFHKQVVFIFDESTTGQIW